jgi:glutathione peroxidase
MIRVACLLLLLPLLSITSLAHGSCPEYLNHEMRKLHSKETVNFCESFAGRPMLVINTASHCGYTPQFKGLEAVHQKYQDQGLVVIGFASDDFKQEDNSEEKAAEICYINYGVNFTMLAPSHVKGKQANPVFRELAEKTKAPSWNFNKYLIDSNGEVVDHFGSNTKPESDKLTNAIEELLASD